jgi:glutaredoxin
MNIPEQSTSKITIYSKSGCPNCTKSKELFNSLNKPYNIINCDEYLLEDRDTFIFIMQQRTGVDKIMFPIIFDEKGEYIAKYNLPLRKASN